MKIANIYHYQFMMYSNMEILVFTVISKMNHHSHLKNSTLLWSVLFFPLGRFRSYFIPGATGEYLVLPSTHVASRVHHGEPMGDTL